MQPFLLVTDSASLADEIQQLVEALLGPIAVEVLHEDGRLALARLEARPDQLAFLPLRMRGMEAVTLLRRLGPEDAGRVLVLAADTLDGCRQAWQCLDLGAADVLSVRGSTQRLKGGREHRMRQIAIHLSRDVAPSRVELPKIEDLDSGRVWIILPETRHLISVAGWLRTQPRTFPVVMQVPEGPRMRKIVGEELARMTQWPVRQLGTRDRLVPGRVHLYSDPNVLSLSENDGRIDAALLPVIAAPGSWAARREQLRALGEGARSFGLLVAEPLEPIESALLGKASPLVRAWTETSGARVKRPGPGEITSGEASWGERRAA